MATARNKMHVDKVVEFESWLHSQGWETRKTTNEYEVLRMKHKTEKGAIVVYRIDSSTRISPTQHHTIEGTTLEWFNKWMKTRKQSQE